MAGERKENIMQVELAIQREMAYRQKVVLLNTKPVGDFRSNLMPMHVQSSNLSPCLNSSASSSLSGIKRHVPASSFEFLRTQQLQLFHCGLVLKNRDNHFCKVCKVPCSGAISYMQHIKGQKHQAKLRELKFSRKNVSEDREVAKQRRRCELCTIWCVNEKSFTQHLEGQKHMAKLQELELARESDGVIAKKPKWCGLCCVWFPDENAFETHLEGKKHFLELNAIENRED